MNSPTAHPEPPELPAHQPSSVELEINRIRELTKARRHGEALIALDPLLSQFPENRDALYLRAMNLRFLNRFDEALGVLERLQTLHPRYSRLYQERGHCYVALRDAPKAIDAFLRGVNINPALPSSWSMLQTLYRMSRDEKNAATAAEHVATLQKMPPPIVQATDLFSDGELTPAENIVRAYLQKHGDHVEGMRLLARIGLERDVLDDAELLLESVLKLAPDYRAARLDYARALYRRQKYFRAQLEMETLLALDSENREYLKQYAASCVGLGNYESIIGVYRGLLTRTPPEDPEAGDLHLWIAHALKTLGRQQESIDEYFAAIGVRPNFGEAWFSLANLKTYRFADDQVQRMRLAEAEPATQAVDRYHLCFALGKALEDARDYAGSWQYYERGNALKHAEARYLPQITETNTRLSKHVCTKEFFEARTGWGVPDPDPIFVLGLPRAGSTLIEQILASHSQVEGTQELADIQRIVMELRGRATDLENPRFPGVLAELGPEDFHRFGERYMTDTRVFRTRGGPGAARAEAPPPFFIDKMPNNFRYIGLIHLMLPNAKIIDARREPLACCFGNLKQLFSTGQEFSYSIDDIARYYRTYLELMRHWNAALPGRILKVQHEGLVDDLEGSVRQILEFCGLPFEPACLDFHKTERSVRTASSEQVRQPIFREGLDQWRNYEAWLEPLQEALGDALTRYRE
jgi:tetratricopeptide (TPR) repeat protein